MRNSSTIDLASMSETIEDILEDYGSQCSALVTESIHIVSKRARKTLKQESPKRTGKYAKGWSIKVDKDKIAPNDIIYGKERSTYAVAHLLEHGHAKRNGGRVAPVPHIADVNDWAEKELVKVVKNKIQGVEV